MKLIVGLGNVGPRYEQTRHNFGFMIADEIARIVSASFATDSRLGAAIALGEWEGERIVIAKPTTMMNLSGESVQKISHFYKIAPEDVWVIFDDVDVPFGKLRIRAQGTSGSGHKGVNSILRHIGNGFVRVKAGISLNDRTKEPSEVYVLKPFSSEERPHVPSATQAAAGVVLRSLTSTEIDTTTNLLAS